jgi:hypothetical protein
MTFPQWLDPTPITRQFIGGFATLPVRTLSQAGEFREARVEFENFSKTGVWLTNIPRLGKGRPKGAKDLKPRKTKKLGPYRRK